MTAPGVLLRALVGVMNAALAATGQPPFEFALTRAQLNLLQDYSGLPGLDPDQPLPPGMGVMGVPVREVGEEDHSTLVVGWSEAIEVELVGGEFDGTAMTIRASAGDVLRLPRMVPVQVHLSLKDALANSSPSFTTDTYRRTRFSTNTQRWRYELERP